jgi:hypothetical protein
LRAVQPGEKPPAKKAPAKRAPRKLSAAVKLSRKTMLEALRDRLATAMEDPRAHPRDMANLTKQFLDVTEKLDTLAAQSGRGKAPAEKSAIANTPNEAWDEGAI